MRLAARPWILPFGAIALAAAFSASSTGCGEEDLVFPGGDSDTTPSECRESCSPVCDTGRACGNSCIASNKTCRSDPGSACDLEDLCETPTPTESASATPSPTPTT